MIIIIIYHQIYKIKQCELMTKALCNQNSKSIKIKSINNPC